MKGLLNLLARAKLVELSEEERFEAATPADHRSAGPLPQTTPATVTSGDHPGESGPVPQIGDGIDADPFAARSETVALADIYAASGVPGSSFPAEKLLRLLEGLRAMDLSTRKAAVLAMDAADDNWEIGDCVADAETKIAALAAYQEQIALQLQQHEQQASEAINQIKLALDNATAAIRQQIAELERTLERSVTRAAQETTNVEAELRAARESAARESRRMDGEIARLREIPDTFKTLSDGQANREE